MHLARLELEHFRGCDRTVIDFHEDVTVLTGENNAGKTTVLDALRLMTAPSDGRRSRYPTVQDIRQGESFFRLRMRMAGLSKQQRGLFYVALDGQAGEDAIFGYQWSEPTLGHRRSRPDLSVGPRTVPDPEPELRDLIRHIHLPALRDASRELASSSPGRIEFLLRHLLGADEVRRKSLLAAVEQSFGRLLTEEPTLKEAGDRVKKSFEPFSDGFHSQEARLGFNAASLGGLARELRFHLRMQGIEVADLAQTGLGYANLLYLASVLVELEAARDAELTLLLIEEPEAHLHPQLQLITLDFLRDQVRRSRDRDVPVGDYAGRIQIVVSTHSPNLTAALSSEHLVVLRSVLSVSAMGEPDSQNEVKAGPHQLPPTVRSIPIGRLGIDRRQLNKVDRYLDATRSNLLFSRRTLLVEGMAEALLIPLFARRLFHGQPGKWKRFLASSIVAIDGVDFEPYVRVLLSSPADHPYPIAEKVVIVTDEDPTPVRRKQHDATVGEDAEEPITGEPSKARLAGQDRKKALMDIARSIASLDALKVLVTPRTLEYALFDHYRDGPSPNPLQEAFISLKSLRSQDRRRKDWIHRIADLPDEEQAEAFMKWIASTNTRKGDLAQALAEQLASGKCDDRRVPEILEQALEQLVAEPEEPSP